MVAYQPSKLNVRVRISLSSPYTSGYSVIVARVPWTHLVVVQICLPRPAYNKFLSSYYTSDIDVTSFLKSNTTVKLMVVFEYTSLV